MSASLANGRSSSCARSIGSSTESPPRESKHDDLLPLAEDDSSLPGCHVSRPVRGVDDHVPDCQSHHGRVAAASHCPDAHLRTDPPAVTSQWRRAPRGPPAPSRRRTRRWPSTVLACALRVRQRTPVPHSYRWGPARAELASPSTAPAGACPRARRLEERDDTNDQEEVLSPRPEPPTMPTSYTTSWDLTSDAYGRCRFLYAFSVARNRASSWLSVFRAAPALSGRGACLLFLHQRQEAR